MPDAAPQDDGPAAAVQHSEVRWTPICWDWVGRSQVLVVGGVVCVGVDDSELLDF